MKLSLSQVKLCSIIICTLLLSACYTLQDDLWSTYSSDTQYASAADKCTSRGAFHAGRRDAANNRPKNSHYANSCLYNNHQLNQAYVEGYNAGSAHTAAVEQGHPADRFGRVRTGSHAQHVPTQNERRAAKLKHQYQQSTTPSSGSSNSESSRFENRSTAGRTGLGGLFSDIRSAAKNKIKQAEPKKNKQADQKSAKRGAGWRCITTNGKKVCGYNCVRSGNNARCADTASKRCIASSTGRISCGYNCTRSIKGVKCTQARGNNCVADSFGNIKCGRNCRQAHDGVECDG